MGMLLSWAVSSFAIWATAKLLPGFDVRSGKAAIATAAVLGALQFLIGWLIHFLIGVGTLGLGFLFGFVTRLVVTAVLLKVTDALLEGFKLKDFRTALLGSVIMTVVASGGEFVVRKLW